MSAFPYDCVRKLEYSPDIDMSCGIPPNPYVRRIDCWQDTLMMCKHLPLPACSVKVCYDIEFDISGHIPPVYDLRNMLRDPPRCFGSSFYRSTIQCVDQDAIDVGLDLVAAGKCPLILNLADDLFAGGCVYQGSGAQEESLFRRTNYHQTLLQEFYPIKPDEAVYSPNVTVLKTSEASGWTCTTAPYPELAFIACPALKYPERADGSRLTDPDVEILKRKIALVIQTAKKYHHDTIVWGAMGCGAWRNPPRHVAEIFKTVLDAYTGVVPNHVFAILTTSGESYIVKDHRKDAHKSTCDIFREVLKDL